MSMRDSSTAGSPSRALLFGALATFGLTALHHVYGGLRYATPWRLHGAAVALVLAVLLAGIHAAYQHKAGTPVGRAFGWALAMVALAVAVVAVGAFEGAYNHVLKDALFLAGAPRDLLLRMFPPPAYELPNDAFFELSGVAQVVPAAFTALATVRFVRALLATGRGGARRSRLAPGAFVASRQLAAVSGEQVRIPDPGGLVHLQFRRFAGCPVCNLHLRAFVRRHEELRAGGAREVVVFHSPAEELREHVARLPFAVVADPDRRLYAEFGVEAAPRALLDPRAWPTVVRAVARSLVAVVRVRERPPAARPHGGRFGLPAEFLVASDGRVLACKYGEHVDDAWSVDDLLGLIAGGKLWTRAARAANSAGV